MATTASIIRKRNPDAYDWLKAQTSEFLKPYAGYFDLSEVEELNERTAFGVDAEPGYFARLSAPGYLNCTDWIGPFDTQEDAYIALYDVWGE